VSLPQSFCALSFAHSLGEFILVRTPSHAHKQLSHYTANPSTALGARNAAFIAFSGQFFSLGGGLFLLSDQK
jgi:hypothetical protein